MDVKKGFYEKLDKGKIEIRQNDNPIKMSEFLSFLTIDVERSSDHSGISYGWTMLFNAEYKLEIKGGIVRGVEYLHDLQFGTKLENRFNNYVNPFYLMDILNAKGRYFFYKYYKEEIISIKNAISEEINEMQAELKSKKDLKKQIIKEIHMMSSYKDQ